MTRTVVDTAVWQQLRALADKTRLDILACLGTDECCVCNLMEATGIPQSLLSFHLRVLKDAGLVSDRREGRWSYYVANTDALRDLADAVDAIAAPKKPARKRRAC